MKAVCLISMCAAVSAFAPMAKNVPMPGTVSSLQSRAMIPANPQSTLPLNIFGGAAQDSEEDEIIRKSRSARKAAPDDRVVDLRKPLGIVLEEDEKGNVYVGEVEEGSNAALSGKVFVGDQLTMCSATFGDELWSTRGVGLGRVMGTIRIRAGAQITLVLENEKEKKDKDKIAKMSAKELAKIAAVKKEKDDKLLAQLNADDVELKKKRFLGLF